jgi:hypothetical protein
MLSTGAERVYSLAVNTNAPAKPAAFAYDDKIGVVKIKKGEVIVIRYEGPSGGPGMREMLSVTASLVGMGLAESVSLVTDGRFLEVRAAPVSDM